MELKKCPFCGGDVKVIKSLMIGSRSVLCKRCRANVIFYGSEYKDSETEMAWNRRAQE